MYPSDDEDGDDAEDATAVSAHAEDDAKQHATRVVGEVEIMIARPDARGKGLAQEALQAFLWYIDSSLPAILNEYTQGRSTNACLSYLRVKIDKDNTRSLALFQKLGFADISGPNYFGEMELRSRRSTSEQQNVVAEKLPYGLL